MRPDVGTMVDQDFDHRPLIRPGGPGHGSGLDFWRAFVEADPFGSEFTNLFGSGILDSTDHRDVGIIFHIIILLITTSCAMPIVRTVLRLRIIRILFSARIG